jgi:transcriptional regulator with XRE-family HTH domain
MTPSGKQIRAARSLAGWERTTLAAKSGLSAVTIRYMENETNTAKKETMDKVIAAFRDVGIEFIENDGVRRVPMGIEIFEGIARFQEFTECVYQYLLNNGGEVCISAVDETLFKKYRNNVDQYRERMIKLVARGDVSVRILASESHFLSAFAQMKWMPQTSTAPTAFYIFGDNLALISFSRRMPPYVVLHKSGPFAEAYREAFNLVWTNAKAPSEKANS